MRTLQRMAEGLAGAVWMLAWGLGVWRGWYILGMSATGCGSGGCCWGVVAETLEGREAVGVLGVTC